MRFLLLFIPLITLNVALSLHPLSSEFIDLINKKQSSWKAVQNFPPNTSMDELKKKNGFLGLHPDPNYKPPTIKRQVNIEDIPESFDARNQWPQCGTLNRIRDQGGCGSCWAFATVEALSDRLCIHKNQDFFFSAEDLLSCCTSCGNCNGGYMMAAYDFYINNGLVSGGDVNSNEGCKPYSQGAYGGITPQCDQNCIGGYPVSYSSDKHYGNNDYVIDNAIEQIQNEVMTNGPIIVNFEVFEDFYNYGSGVYYYTYGGSMGYHVVKLIGWGTENGVPYWLIANSWGSWWGENGFFKIRRGTNECGIENNPYGALP